MAAIRKPKNRASVTFAASLSLFLVQCGEGTVEGCATDADCVGNTDHYCDRTNHECKPRTCVPKSCQDLAKQCGSWDHGCFGNVDCGTCAKPETCNNKTGKCESGCVPDCQGRECGFDPLCGVENCGTCSGPDTCNLLAGTCECAGDCSDRQCGPDPVCGTQSCGKCTEPDICNTNTGRCEACAPDCGTRECGPVPNGCGERCGTCQEANVCLGSECVATAPSYRYDFTAKTGSVIMNFRFSAPFPTDPGTNFGVGFFGHGRGIEYRKTGETHTWGWQHGTLGIDFVDSRKQNNSDIIAILDQCYGANPGVADWTSYNIGWHEVRFIYDGTKLRVFIDGFAYPSGEMTASDLDGLPWVDTEYVSITANDGVGNTFIDAIQIYPDELKYPTPKIEYAQYVDEPAWVDGSTGYIPESLRNGILVSGRNTNGAPITLSDIADSIQNTDLFSYDPATKIANLYTNLVIDSGSYLAINGETLNVNSATKGGLEMRLRDTGDVDIVDSTVTSPLQPFRWIVAGERFYNPWPWGYPSPSNMPNEFYLHPNGIPFNYQGTFRVINSIISNSGNLYLSGAIDLQLKNSSLALTTITAGPAGHPEGGRNNVAVRSGNAHSFSLRADLLFDKLILEGLHITSIDTTPINLVFIGGDETIKYKVLKDSIIDANIMMLGSVDIFGSSPRRNTLSLINVKTTGTTTMDTEDTKLLRKYYLDVRVVDNLGNPVQGATVTVANEQDDANYPSQNLFDGKRWTNWWDEGYTYYNAIDSMSLEKGKDLTSATTDVNGRTPLPSDILNTLVITDYKQENNYENSGISGRTDYTHTISATSGGKTAISAGVDPDETWFRTNANMPVISVKCNIDAGTCIVAGADVGTKKGTTRDYR